MRTSRTRSLLVVAVLLSGAFSRAQAARILVGTSGHRYEVGRLAGHGGFGQVYKAWPLRAARDDRKIRGRAVAIKEFESLAPAIEEDQSLASIAGLRRLPRLLDDGFDERRQKTFLVTRWVEGKTLDAWVRSRRPSTREVVSAVIEAARIVGDLHVRGWLHLDLKPQNIMIDARRRVNVIDIGNAQRMGADGKVVASGAGTPRFMSPEQHARAEVDERADVFALATTIDKLVGREDPALRAVLARGMAAGPADRYPTTRVLVDALVDWRSGVGRRRLAVPLASRRPVAPQ